MDLKKINTKHTQTQHKQQCPSAISLVSFANHAVCSILMIIMSEYNLLFFARVLRWTLPSSPTEWGSEAQCKTTIVKTKMPSWIRLCGFWCGSGLLLLVMGCWCLIGIEVTSATVNHPVSVHIQGVGHFASCSRFFRGVFTSFTCSTR